MGEQLLKLFLSGSNLGTPWHLKKELSHVFVGIRPLHCEIKSYYLFETIYAQQTFG